MIPFLIPAWCCICPSINLMGASSLLKAAAGVSALHRETSGRFKDGTSTGQATLSLPNTNQR